MLPTFLHLWYNVHLSSGPLLLLEPEIDELVFKLSMHTILKA